MNFLQLVGETLDGKYKIERELGKGGMGTVYFATHLGTERPVAVKVIVPQFMQKAEFVERFRREARAAGRLRHPNVVDVTDFGIADTKDGKVAYLVMEYLDGCTLGEILEEEKQLPLSFTLDILEQVCFAVQEAHEQGIIHRDLKPDNIWLEPNQRGGYTVKVLDFGIAKLEEAGSFDSQNINLRNALPTQSFQTDKTVADQTLAKTIAENQNSTMISESNTAIFHESGTLVQTDDSEQGTAILDVGEQNTAILSDKKTQILNEEGGTQLLSVAEDTDNSTPNSTANLTRVGAVLGTPLYMSPEQCRGEKLTSRSDIYSLAVIAYQMLAGKTPFAGEFMGVMESHKNNEPPPLEAKKVSKKVKRVIHAALAKNIEERPPTAEAFASEMRSYSEGIGSVFQRAVIIYSQHFTTFLTVAFLTLLPWLVLSLINSVIEIGQLFEVIDDGILMTIAKVSLQIIGFFVQIFSGAFLVGIVSWLIAQALAMPLRAINTKFAVDEVKKRWKPLLKTVTVSSLLTMIAMPFCIIPGVWLSARFMLIPPSVMLEGLSGREAFRRSAELSKRSFRTVFGTAFLMFVLPMLLATFLSGAIIGIAGGFNDSGSSDKSKVEKKDSEDGEMKVRVNGAEIKIGGKTSDNSVKDSDDSDDDDSPKEKDPVKEKQKFRVKLATNIFTLLWLPIVALVSSFVSVITALLYFKTRLAGGESMQDLLQKFEAADSEKTSKWQNRIRERLQQSGRVTSKT
jgi:serine/threonine protein kinase